MRILFQSTVAKVSSNFRACRTLDKDGLVALQVASREGYAELVKLLASNARGSVNARSDSGFTALHFAATEGHEPCARVLLEYGANVDAEDDLGATALHYAIMKCAPHLALMITAHGCIITSRILVLVSLPARKRHS